jgi:FixJ family two-component response regulator
MKAPAPVLHVVDDDASFLTSLARWLRGAGYAVERYASAAEFLERRQPGAPGCVLADLQMPGLNGLELQAALASGTDPLPVVFLTGHGDLRTSVRAMKQGAEDFLSKTAPKEELLAAIQSALARDAQDRVDRARGEGLRRRLETLTSREQETLVLVARGLLNKEIAARLGIHERTVKLHRTTLTRKLGVHSAAELALLAREAGILPEGAVERPAGAP